MSNIVNRLRAWCETGNCFGLDSIGKDCKEAADEIESLTAKVKELESDLLRARNSDEHNFNRWQAEQSKVKVLTDALEQIVGNAEECTDSDDWMAMVISMDAYHICDEALATVKEGK